MTMTMPFISNLIRASISNVKWYSDSSSSLLYQKCILWLGIFCFLSTARPIGQCVLYLMKRRHQNSQFVYRTELCHSKTSHLFWTMDCSSDESIDLVMDAFGECYHAISLIGIYAVSFQSSPLHWFNHVMFMTPLKYEIKQKLVPFHETPVLH